MKRRKLMLWGLAVLAGIGVACSWEIHAVAPVEIMMAYATSTSADSTSLSELLKPGGKGLWKPQTRDAGVQEGIYLQFTNPVSLDWIEVVAGNGVAANCNLDFFLDGKRNIPQRKPKAQDQPEDRVEYWVASQDQGKERRFFLGARKPGSYSQEEYADLNTKVKAVFIKVASADKVPEFTAIRFFRHGQKSPLQVAVPGFISGSAVANSTLAPQTAYGVHHLFDAQTEFAWATDGKKTNGKGAVVALELETPQALGGLIIWNGYQRSATHYLANSRPASLSVQLNDAHAFNLKVEDRSGAQVLRFPKTTTGVRRLKLTVTGVYPGKTYRDLAISELKLLDQDNNPLVLAVAVPKAAVPEKIDSLLDRVWKPYMQGIVNVGKTDSDPGYGEAYDYPSRSIRLRSNGSFVGYSSDGFVSEGNWEAQPDGVRIFGKKYLTYADDAVYMQENKANSGVKIFQDKIKVYQMAVTPYTPEIKKYLQVLLADRSYYQPERRKWETAVWYTGVKPYGKVQISGKTEEQLLKACYEKAVALKACLLVSPLFTDLFLPGEEVEVEQEYGP